MRARINTVSQLVFVATLVVALATPATADQDVRASAPTCQSEGRLVRIPELPEASGIVVSKQSPGRLWAHNDSGQPMLIALDRQGSVAGKVRVSGVKVEDWEAAAVGPCPAGNCIYLGDIGDNDGQRSHITIYRIPEPVDGSDAVAVADMFRATYPDGAHDAEALLVTPAGDMLIVTKGDTGPVSLYRVPANAAPGGTVKLQQIGKARQSGKVAADERITDGAVSPSGAWVALRTKTSLLLHRTSDLLSGNWREAHRVSLQALGEPQGEGIAFADERTIYLVGEGGGKAQPGTFGRLRCSF